MSDITTEQAKEAFRKMIQRGGWAGGISETERLAMHAWANSPDPPEPLPYGEFKARVKAAIDSCYRQARASFMDTVWIDRTFGALLAECEPPAPPKPKFAAGNVVMDLVLGLPHKITSCGEGVCEMTDSSTWPENRLRELTPEEKGSA